MGLDPRGDQAQVPPPLPGGEVPLLVARGQAPPLGQDPDLQEMDGFGRRGVVLAVHHAGARAHPLRVAGTDHRARTQAVPVLERAGEHPGEDLHVAMPVGRESRPGLHPILVDHAQAPEAHVRGVVVVGEGERVARVEPAVVGMPALARPPHRDHPRRPLKKIQM